MLVDVNFDEFDWDRANEEKILRKHGISRIDIERAVKTRAFVLEDLKHSTREARFVGVGENWSQRRLLVVFTLRKIKGLVLLRPISARYMHSKEWRWYENLKGR